MSNLHYGALSLFAYWDETDFDFLVQGEASLGIKFNPNLISENSLGRI